MAARSTEIANPSAPPIAYEALRDPLEAADAWLRIEEVLALIGVGRTTLYRWIEQGNFPKPHPIGPRASRWLLSEYQAWSAARAKIAAH